MCQVKRKVNRRGKKREINIPSHRESISWLSIFNDFHIKYSIKLTTKALANAICIHTLYATYTFPESVFSLVFTILYWRIFRNAKQKPTQSVEMMSKNALCSFSLSNIIDEERKKKYHSHPANVVLDDELNIVKFLQKPYVGSASNNPQRNWNGKKSEHLLKWSAFRIDLVYWIGRVDYVNEHTHSHTQTQTQTRHRHKTLKRDFCFAECNLKVNKVGIKAEIDEWKSNKLKCSESIFALSKYTWSEYILHM